MTGTKVVKCVFNDYWSLVWSQHGGCWVLTLHLETGDDETILFSSDELRYLIDLLEVYKDD